MIGPVTLPWPDKVMSPNARVHWAKKAKAVKLSRDFAKITVRSIAGAYAGAYSGWKSARLTFAFHPPDKRRRDADSMLSMMKASIDGIADALAMDDNTFSFAFSVKEPVKGGAVIVTIENGEE